MTSWADEEDKPMDFSQAPGLLQPLPEPPKSTIAPRTPTTNPWKNQGKNTPVQRQQPRSQSKRSMDYRQDIGGGPSRNQRQMSSGMRRGTAQYWAKFENFPAGSPMHELQEFFREMELNVSNLTIKKVSIKGHDRLDAECSLPNREELEKCLTQLNEMVYIENVLRVTDISAMKKSRSFNSPSAKEGRAAAGVGWYRGLITKTAAGRDTVRPPPLEVFSPPQGQNRYESRFHAPVRRGRNFSGRQMGNRGPMQQSMQQKADAEGFSRVKPNRRNRREGRRSGGGYNSRFGGPSGGQQSGGRFSGLRPTGQSNRRQNNRLRQDRGNNRSFGSGRQQQSDMSDKQLNKPPQKRQQNRFAAFIDQERIRDEE